LQIDNFNFNVYTPLQTVLLRHNDRSAITSSRIDKGGRDSDEQDNKSNRNQLDKLIIQIDKSENLNTSVDIIQRILKRRHADVQDFNITVPELLLKQEQKTRSIFNIVLAAIASISLIVGGIGIMNIMLASVLERVREIGLRRAIGAKKEDVILQFIAEATIISFTGGVLGVILGIVIAELISQFTEISTIVSGFSIFISFMVSVGVGLIFGYMPAKKAALQDPVTSLRHE
jgi:putative ABC transport system permease protein